MESPPHSVEPWHLTRSEYEQGLWLHGTQKEFDVFRDDREYSTCFGHFLTKDVAVAEYYAFGKRRGQVLPVHVRAPLSAILDLREPEVFRQVLEESWISESDFDEMWDAHEAGELYNRSMGKDQEALLYQAAHMGARGALLWDRTQIVDTSLAIFKAEDLMIAPEHQQAVEQALRAGYPVPAQVLAEYPSLGKRSSAPRPRF